MPDFPRYQSKAQPTTQQPSVGAPEDTTGEILAQNAQMGQQVQEATMKWSNAVDAVQKTTATANFKSAILEEQTNFTNIPQPTIQDYEKSRNAIRKIKEKNLEGFSSKSAQMEASIDFDYQARVAEIQLDNYYKKKFIETGKEQSSRLIDIWVSEAGEDSLTNIKNQLAYDVKVGLRDKTEAYAIEKKANDNLGVNRIYKDLYSAQTTEEVEMISQRLSMGEYEKGGVTIEPDSKKSLNDIIETTRRNTEKREEAIANEALAQNRVDVLSGVASGQVPIESVDTTALSEYDPQLAEVLTTIKPYIQGYNPQEKDAKYVPRPAGLGVSTSKLMRFRDYTQSITDIFMQADNKQLSEFMLRELKKQGDGTNSSIKIAAFTNLASLKAKVNNPKSPDDLKAADRFFAIKKAIGYLQSANKFMAPQAVGEFVVRNYLSGASSVNQTMGEAKSTLMDMLIDRYKSAAKLPFTPNKIVDGEAPVEDIQSGANELEEGYYGSYADAPSDY